MPSLSEPRAQQSAGAVGGSFRDPAGRLVNVKGCLLRLVHPEGVPHLQAFLGSATRRALTQAGRVVATDALNASEARRLIVDAGPAELQGLDMGMVLEHERIPFSSFPYEWPPEMLQEAGRLTLDLAEGLLAEGLGLKDATPYNVLFRGPEAVFVDVLSIERRDPGDPTWLPYAQFVRTIVLPLLVNRHFGAALDQRLLTQRDGLQPEEVYRLCSPLQRCLPPFLTLVAIPTWLGARQDPGDARIYQRAATTDPVKARFILAALFSSLRRTLDALAPSEDRRSAWSGYMASKAHYTPEHFAAKSAFVSEALAEFRPRQVLDIGCNTGHFSVLAARAGARVVAIDNDPVVVGQVWRTARAERLDILPLVVDVARPSPAVGWRNEECPAFLERARGVFDCVCMLAVVHHLLVSERIPLPAIVDLAAELTSDLLVIEFIAPEDRMFQRLTRGREALFAALTPEVFEAACRRHFEILRHLHPGGASRRLYLLRKKGGGHAAS